MQKGSIRVQTENIFPIIKKFLYSEHDIFLRELVSAHERVEVRFLAGFEQFARFFDVLVVAAEPH